MSTEILLTFAVLGVTVVLFVTEKLRVDIVALIAMLAVAWLGLVTPSEAVAGFSSNAVISIIGVMILGRGVDRSGIMAKVARNILRVAGTGERRLVGLASAAAGTLSAFMQNIGAAALFLPTMLRIAKRTGLSESRLLMPIGFAALIGGTLTMVASGPLIILNDLLRQGGEAPFSLFAVTPVGLTLLGACILYFLVFGRFVLPGREGGADESSPQQELADAWNLASQVTVATVTEESRLVGKTIEEADLWSNYGLNLLMLREGDDVQPAPWRQSHFVAGQALVLLGSDEQVTRFASDQGVELEKETPEWLENELAAGGFAELVVLPRAPLAGKSLREFGLRKSYLVEPIVLLAGAERQPADFSDKPLSAGDVLVVHGSWEQLRQISRDPSFAVLTPIEGEETDPSKGVAAALCFAGAIGLAISGQPLSVSLLTGAVLMVLLGVLTMDEAYRAVNWKTVFLLAGLIPLGTAMDNTGAAAFVATELSALLAGSHTIVLMLAVAIMSSVFSLFMSNVAATVILAPLAMIMGDAAGVDGRALALLAAVCTDNSLVLPTHQVNALFMSPGGYRNADYIRAGGFMSIIYLVVVVSVMYVFYI
ncbi:MAG: SLC13 family permease [Woeseiaceae bacterium]